MAVPIYVIGSSNTDMVVKVRKLPLPGETVIGGDFLVNPGGKGANQAVAASRLGGQVHFVANIGSDVFGYQSVQNLSTAEKIDTSLITMDENHPSGVALIAVDESGENCIAVAPGSNSFFTIEQASSALKRISAPAVVVLQLEIPIETVDYIIQTAQAKGLTLILNPAPAQPLSSGLLAGVDWVTPNETEAEKLTGIRVEDEKTAIRAAVRLHAMGAEHIVITMGSRGAFLHTQLFSILIPSPAIDHVVDTTAAGDCFNGALAVALAEGMNPSSAIGFACLAASRSVTKMGAQSSMPFRNELNFT